MTGLGLSMHKMEGSQLCAHTEFRGSHEHREEESMVLHRGCRILSSAATPDSLPAPVPVAFLLCPRNRHILSLFRRYNREVWQHFERQRILSAYTVNLFDVALS